MNSRLAHGQSEALEMSAIGMCQVEELAIDFSGPRRKIPRLGLSLVHSVLIYVRLPEPDVTLANAIKVSVFAA